MSIEQTVSQQLNRYPFIKKGIKRVYQRTSCLLSKPFSHEGDIERISPDDSGHEYFFGYYDKSPENADGRYVLCLKANDTWTSAAPAEEAEILLIDLSVKDGEPGRIRSVAKTHAWNVQQGCMMQWLGPEYDRRIIYNDFREGHLCSVILDIVTMEQTVLCAPVYSNSSDGTFALTLDFTRLHRLRPGYGYSNLPDLTEHEKVPSGAAIRRLDLITNELSDVLDYKDLISFEPRSEMNDAECKVNHIMLSPDNKRFMVIFRWFDKGRKYSRLLTCDTDGTNLFNLSDDDMVSHCFWRNNEEIIAFENKKESGAGYYLMKDRTREYRHLWPFIHADGHPSFSPDGTMVISDTYPNRRRIARLMLWDGSCSEEERPKIPARVFAPFKYDNDTRCDLHPRFSRDGNSVYFDSVFEGHRGLYRVAVRQAETEQTVSDSPGLISVVIPTHNRADLLQRAVKSVQDQTYQNVEIIIVSDGSTDNTEEIAQKMADEDTRIRYFGYTPAKGGNYARNLGIANAKGELIAFLDDDDEWMNDKLEKQIRALHNNPGSGISFTGSRIIYVNEDVTYLNIPSADGDLSRKILLSNLIGTTSTVLVTRKALEKAGVFDEKLPALQDYELWIRVCEITRAAAVREPLINYYNYRSGEQISGSTGKYINAFSSINEKHKDLFGSLNAQEQKTKKVNELLLIANKAMRNNSPKEARKYIYEALAITKSKKAMAYLAMSMFDYKTVLKLRRQK